MIEIKNMVPMLKILLDIGFFITNAINDAKTNIVIDNNKITIPSCLRLK